VHGTCTDRETEQVLAAFAKDRKMQGSSEVVAKTPFHHMTEAFTAEHAASAIETPISNLSDLRALCGRIIKPKG